MACKTAGMRLLYAYEGNHLDPAVQSGRPFHVRQALLARGFELVDCPNVGRGLTLPLRPIQLMWKLRGKTWRPDRHPLSLRIQASRVASAWRQSGAQAIVSPSSLAVAMMAESLPTFIVADAFFHYAADRYPAFSNLAPPYRQHAEAAEARALGKAEGFVVPTPDVEAALHRHQLIPAANIRVASWGPNFAPPPGLIDSHRIDARLAAPRILFVGREWQRKGFDVVTDTLRQLRARGIILPLDIAGLNRRDVPAGLLAHIGDQCQFLGNLSASDEQHNRRMRQAFEQAALLMVPTRAENFGITFVEALRYGLPLFAYDIDGLRASVGHSRAAHLLPPGSDAGIFASAIEALLRDADHYRSLARDALADSERYSWLAVADALAELIEQSARHGKIAERMKAAA